MTLKQASAITGIAPANLRRALLAGKLVGTKVDGEWDVLRSDLDAYESNITRGRPRSGEVRSVALKIICTQAEADALRLKAKGDFSSWARAKLLA